MKEQNYELTIKAAFLGYVVQAVVNNFLPLVDLILFTFVPVAEPEEEPVIL